MKKIDSKKGFTLLEILLVVGIIAILAGIVIIAINPARQLKTTRDSERRQMVSTINKAMVQFYIDHAAYPGLDTDLSSSTTEICNTGGTASSTDAACASAGLINLSQLVPTYIQAVPMDPSGGIDADGTGYRIAKNSGNNIYVEATQAELSNISLGSTAGVTGMSSGSL